MPMVLSPPVLVGWLAVLGWRISTIGRPGRLRGKFGRFRIRSPIPLGPVATKVGKGVVLLIVFAAAIYASTRASVPAPLPGVAMGWTPLFHVMRAGAMLGAIGIVALIGWRALSGEFPIKFGNVEYAAKETAAEAKQAAALQEQRIRTLEVLADVRKPEDLDGRS